MDCTGHACRPQCCRARVGRAVRAVSLCGLTLMLTSCAVGPDFQVPAPPALKGFLPGQGDGVPGSTVVRGADIPARWWEPFRSRRIEPADRGRHRTTIADLQAAEAAVRVAQANALAQRGTLFPVVAASFDASRQLMPTRDAHLERGHRRGHLQPAHRAGQRRVRAGRVRRHAARRSKSPKRRPRRRRSSARPSTSRSPPTSRLPRSRRRRCAARSRRRGG